MGWSIRFPWLAGLALAALFVPGTARAQSAQPYRLKLPMVIAPELVLPTLVAHASGYLAEEQIELADVVTGSGGTLRTALVAREFEFGLLAFVHVPIARVAGSPLKVILSTHNHEIFSLLARSQLKDRVRSVADLRGLKVGFSTPGAGSWYLGSLFLKKAGLSPEKDVEFISLGADPGVIYTSLKTGKVDAFATWEPTTTRLIEDGVAYPLVRIWEPGEHRNYIGEKALSMVLVTRDEVIREKPDVVKRLVNAHKKALGYIAGHGGAEIVGLIMSNPKSAQLFQGIDRAMLAKIVDRVKPGFGDGCISRGGFDVEMGLAVEYKLVKRAISFEEFADPSFAGACP